MALPALKPLGDYSFNPGYGYDASSGYSGGGVDLTGYGGGPINGNWIDFYNGNYQTWGGSGIVIPGFIDSSTQGGPLTGPGPGSPQNCGPFGLYCTGINLGPAIGVTIPGGAVAAGGNAVSSAAGTVIGATPIGQAYNAIANFDWLRLAAFLLGLLLIGGGLYLLKPVQEVVNTTVQRGADAMAA